MIRVMGHTKDYNPFVAKVGSGTFDRDAKAGLLREVVKIIRVVRFAASRS